MFGTDFKILEELSIHQYWDSTNTFFMHFWKENRNNPEKNPFLLFKKNVSF